MDHIEVNGGRLAYRVHGPGEPVVLLHPGCIADGMARLADRPAMAGCRIVTFHRRGYGEIDRVSGPFSIRDHAADVVALLDRLEIERAHVVGHSLGGTIALQVSLLAPDRVGHVHADGPAAAVRTQL